MFFYLLLHPYLQCCCNAFAVLLQRICSAAATYLQCHCKMDSASCSIITLTIKKLQKHIYLFCTDLKIGKRQQCHNIQTKQSSKGRFPQKKSVLPSQVSLGARSP